MLVTVHNDVMIAKVYNNVMMAKVYKIKAGLISTTLFRIHLYKIMGMAT